MFSQSLTLYSLVYSYFLTPLRLAVLPREFFDIDSWTAPLCWEPKESCDWVFSIAFLLDPSAWSGTASKSSTLACSCSSFGVPAAWELLAASSALAFSSSSSWILALNSAYRLSYSIYLNLKIASILSFISEYKSALSSFSSRAKSLRVGFPFLAILSKAPNSKKKFLSWVSLSELYIWFWSILLIISSSVW